MASDEIWQSLEFLVRRLDDRHAGPPVTGRLVIEDASVLAAIKNCLKSEADTNLRITSGEDVDGLSIGQTICIEVSPRTGYALLPENTSILLKAPKALIREPARYLLLSDLTSKADTPPEDHELTRYRAALSLVSMLERASAFLDKEKSIFVFIHEGKFELPVSYDVEDLKEASIEDLKALACILPEGTHQKQCEGIMAEAVISLTKNQPSPKRFQYILEHAKELHNRYEEGYRLFASGFSYEKVRDQVEAARIEYTGKIHKVLSDIQNQILGIPVATVIVATQMKNTIDVDAIFWINTSVLIGCWIFAALVALLLHNQSHSLDVIRVEVDRQKRQLLNEFSAVAISFEKTFNYLEKRLSTQKLIIRSIDVIVVLGLILSHIVYLKLTKPASIWITSLLPCLNRFFG